MKSKSLVFKSAVLAVFLSGLIFQADLAAGGQYDDIENKPMNEVVHFMTRTNPPKKNLAGVIKKANSDPAFRKGLVGALTYRLSVVTANVHISNTVRALRDLDARHVLPQFKKIWNETEKKAYGLYGGMRVQLLRTIAEFLPETESIQFLIDTESDKTEAPKVRFRATILLCETGNEKAIKHVLSVYENAKKQFPLNPRILMNDQKGYIERTKGWDEKRNPWDTDRDLLSSYFEKGMLLDPNNMDTDGDGLIDGNDRNPLCKPPQKSEPTVDQDIAHFILYLHARYDTLSRSPFNFKLFMVRPVDTWDGKGNKSLFDGMQFRGIDGFLLHMDQKRIDKFRAIHGSGTSVIGIHKELESKDRKDIKEFRISVSGGRGLHRTYDITFKRFDNIWLPISWKLGMIT